MPGYVRSTGSMRFEYHAEAEAELDAAIAYYSAVSLTLGNEFGGWLRRISDHPEIGERYADSDCRKVVLRRFPYLVFYEVEASLIRIIAFAHGSRQPNYWRHRIE
jgi:toxin ParE1/3/4